MALATLRKLGALARIVVHKLRGGLTMARTTGAKNKMPRELEAAAKALLERARLTKQNAKLKAENTRLKKKLKG
jgi:hypothetical protein